MLSPLYCMSSDDTVYKCISVASYGRLDVGISQTSTAKDESDHIVSDSGATSHMRQNKSNFENYSITCNDVFVLMGDNSEIPVLGFGTSRMKINGHVT